MEDKRYFSRSWAMLTRDRGWFKPLLVMSAANMVPVAGALGNKGYGLEWARLTAWGVDSAPKQKGVKVGKCIASGWRGFVVSLVWGLAYLLVMIIAGVLENILPGVLGTLVSNLLALVSTLVAVVWSVVTAVAEVRAAIYESIGAGLRFGPVFEMIKRDTDGFIRVVLINLVGMLIFMVAGFMMALVVSAMFVPTLIQLMSGDPSSYAIIATVATTIALATPLIVVCGYAIAFVANGLRLLVVNAVGLWMRQFNVAEWGRSEDPLPSMDDRVSWNNDSEYAAEDSSTQPEPGEPKPFHPQPFQYEVQPDALSVTPSDQESCMESDSQSEQVLPAPALPDPEPESEIVDAEHPAIEPDCNDGSSEVESTIDIEFELHKTQVIDYANPEDVSPDPEATAELLRHEDE